MSALPPRLMSDPRSIKQLLRDSGMPLGGAVRADLARELDDALFVTWLSALADHGDAAQAAVQMWWVVSWDVSFKHPLWLELVFKRHKAAIVQAHHDGEFRH